MKEFIEEMKSMFEDEQGEFQITEVIAGVGFALLIPMLWVFLYALGCN